MNHIPNAFLAADAAPLTRRAVAKLRTRESLIAAAKTMFTQRGYEDATVRDIARAAGMSTGAVFANFTDKSDLFQAVLAEDDRALMDIMRNATVEKLDGAKPELMAIFRAAYAFHLKQLPLLQAAQAEGWRSAPRQAAADKIRLRQSIATVEGVLYKAIANSELRSGIDVELAADLIWQAYQANYRLAIHEGLSLEDLVAQFSRQLDMILPSLAVR